MKKILLIFVICMASLSAYSQQRDKGDGKGGRREHIEALRVGYFTDELSLSVVQSQAFWPLFNEYCDAMRTLNKRGHELFNKIKGATATISDANNWLDIEEQKVSTKRSFQARFLEILTPDQVAKMYAAEEGFKQELIRSTYKRRD